VNTILYLYDLEVDFNNILLAVDEDASEYWLATMRPYWVSHDESWNVLDEINRERAFNREFSRLLYGFYATFMMISVNLVSRKAAICVTISLLKKSMALIN